MSFYPARIFVRPLPAPPILPTPPILGFNLGMDDPVLQPGFCVGPGGGEVGENESVCIRTICR